VFRIQQVYTDIDFDNRTNGNDSGAGSLRQALETAGNNGAYDIINIAAVRIPSCLFALLIRRCGFESRMVQLCYG